MEESDLVHITHESWCCDERERAHVHVDGGHGVFSSRLALDEWPGEEGDVLAAVDGWLAVGGYDG